MTDSWMSVAKEALKVPTLLVDLYGDLAKPGVQQVGKALETVLGLGNTLLWPLALANDRARVSLQHNMESYRRRLADVPIEAIVPVPPEIGVPVAEKLSYVSDVDLSALYVALLAKSSTHDGAQQVHPAFVSIINSLSPDEARLISATATPEIEIAYLSADWLSPDQSFIVVAGQYQYLVAQDIYQVLYWRQNFPAYISNLVGLGILADHPDKELADEGKYADLRAHWDAELVGGNPEYPNYVCRYRRGFLNSTIFGDQFIRACK